MASIVIKANQFSEAVNKVLQEYSEEVDAVLERCATEVAENAVSELKSTSPKRAGKGGGKYAKSWNVKREKSRLGVSVIVYNKGHAQLTHLLEFGHVNRDGSRAREFPHIANAEQTANTDFVELIERELSK